MDTDELRARVDAQEALAKALFEAQFTLCGGRMPDDPTWDDLDESQRDDFRGEAQRARVVLDAALAAQVAGVETVTEWGVRWDGDGFWKPPAQGIFADEGVARDAVRQFAADCHPGYHAAVVSRTVTRTEWRTVDDAP